MPCSRAEGKSQQIPTGWNLSNQTGHLWDVLTWLRHISWCFSEVNCRVLIVFRPAEAGVGACVSIGVCVCVHACMHVCVCVCVPCLVASQAHQCTCVEDVRVASL